MKLVTGLGNIGDKYCFTRHNAGFMVLDKIAIDNNLTFREEKKLKCLITKCRINGEDTILAKPTTYMNLSGESVISIINYYKIDIKDVLIIFDDLSLDLGRMRFRANGSDGGHNGIKSIIQHIGTKDFARLKIGIGPQPPIPAESFVLQNFPQEQLEVLKEVLKRAETAVEYYFKNGIEKAQNEFN